MEICWYSFQNSVEGNGKASVTLTHLEKSKANIEVNLARAMLICTFAQSFLRADTYLCFPMFFEIH
jgi:hypothetical protein